MNRLVVRHINESTASSASVSWSFDKEPVSEVTRARDVKDYYKATLIVLYVISDLWERNFIIGV